MCRGAHCVPLRKKWNLKFNGCQKERPSDKLGQWLKLRCVSRKTSSWQVAVRLWGFGWVELAFWLLSDIFVDNFWMYWKYGVYSVFQNDVLC